MLIISWYNPGTGLCWFKPDTLPYTLHVTGDEDDPAHIYATGGPYFNSGTNQYYVGVHVGDERACNLYISIIFRGLVPQGFDIPDNWVYVD